MEENIVKEGNDKTKNIIIIILTLLLLSVSAFSVHLYLTNETKKDDKTNSIVEPIRL